MDAGKSERGQNEEVRESRENRSDGNSNDHIKDIRNYHQNISRSESNQMSKKSRTRSRSRTPQRNHRQRSRSHSHSPSTGIRKPWASSNAFLNFVQDFRQSTAETRSAKVIQLASEQWRKMSSKEKEPYIEAAKLIKQQNHDKKGNEENSKQHSSTNQKRGKVPQKEKKKEKEHNYTEKYMEETDSDSASATSGTDQTMTSDNMSDSSSQN